MNRKFSKYHIDIFRITRYNTFRKLNMLREGSIRILYERVFLIRRNPKCLSTVKKLANSN